MAIMESMQGAHKQMLFDEDAVADMAEALKDGAPAVTRDNMQRRLVLVPTNALGMEGPVELGVFYETRGAFYFDGKSELNQFRLTNAGFSMMVAAEVADLVNRVIRTLARLHQIEHIQGARPRSPAEGGLLKEEKTDV